MAHNGTATGAHLLLGLGGSLDVFAGVVQRAPEIFRKLVWSGLPSAHVSAGSAV
ncbi:MAG: WecB/TagA/CpsF family glycosyltransferase [Ruthenibacterium lactatiformans]|uniref:WecB/TagA/CpsF family glycosyltransferase n=1 Tax=Ruthenibacterium lactatiformans TaxID=1550024 RepID=UPI003993B4C1